MMRDVRLLVAEHDESSRPTASRQMPEDRGHGQHVDERAPEDQLDVHQAVLDDRVGQRERDEGERDVAGELHRQPRLAPEGEGDRVEERRTGSTPAPVPQTSHFICLRAVRLRVRR